MDLKVMEFEVIGFFMPELQPIRVGEIFGPKRDQVVLPSIAGWEQNSLGGFLGGAIDDLEYEFRPLTHRDPQEVRRFWLEGSTREVDLEYALAAIN
jgi:hypothetical protein